MADRQQHLKHGEIDLSTRLSEAEAEIVKVEQQNRHLQSEVEKRDQFISEQQTEKSAIEQINQKLTAEVQRRDNAIREHNTLAETAENHRVSIEKENKELKIAIKQLRQTGATVGMPNNLDNAPILQELTAAGSSTSTTANSIRGLSDAMSDLCSEMKIAQGGTLVQVFSGEGHSQFNTWVREMERTKLRINGTDERMRSLALATLKGAAADYLVRILHTNPYMSWRDILRHLKERYCDLADARYAKQNLRALEQTRSESVQNFSERVYLAAQEAFPGQDIDTDSTLQGILVDVFINGLRNASIARHLIRTNPRSFDQAVVNAAQEQQTLRSIKLQQTTKRSEEPMEVDVHDPTPNASATPRIDKLEGHVLVIAESVGKLIQRQEDQERSVRVNTRNRRQPRTDRDGRLICYHCGRPGHIARECRQRQGRELNRPGGVAGADDQDNRTALAGHGRPLNF